MKGEKMGLITEEAIKLLKEYRLREFNMEDDKNIDLTNYPILYSTFDDEEKNIYDIEIQISTNIIEREFIYEIGDFSYKERFSDDDYIMQLMDLDFESWYSWAVHQYFDKNPEFSIQFTGNHKQTSSSLNSQEIRVINKAAHNSGMDCWLSFDDNNMPFDLENNQSLDLNEALSDFFSGIVDFEDIEGSKLNLTFNDKCTLFSLAKKNNIELRFNIHPDVSNYVNSYGASSIILLESKNHVNNIIDERLPLGKFVVLESSSNSEFSYAAIDNTSGDAWTEDFNSLEDCFLWLDDIKSNNQIEKSTKKPR